MRDCRVPDPVLFQHCEEEHPGSRAKSYHELHRQRCQRYASRIPCDDCLQNREWKRAKHERAAGGV